jgi:hypothetical protein
MELRQRAQDKMGVGFDIRKFHEMLESGVMYIGKKRLTLGSQRNKMTSNYSYKEAFGKLLFR